MIINLYPMLNIGINLLTPTFFVAVSLLSFLLGFFIRFAITTKLKKKILNLETEMIDNHAEILNLTELLAKKEIELQKADTPVITIGASKSREKNGW